MNVHKVFISLSIGKRRWITKRSRVKGERMTKIVIAAGLIIVLCIIYLVALFKCGALSEEDEELWIDEYLKNRKE